MSNQEYTEKLSRDEVIEDLESIGVACYDNESTSLLREAMVDSMECGDIVPWRDV